jgi:hypothetical protein
MQTIASFNGLPLIVVISWLHAIEASEGVYEKFLEFRFVLPYSLFPLLAFTATLAF